MGKKGSWFSAIKRALSPNCKEKSAYESEKKNSKGKKKGRGILRSGETKSFIPLFREPSSIEKILCEADEQKLLRPPTTSEEPKTPSCLPASSASPNVSPLRVASPCLTSPRDASPKVGSSGTAFPRVVPPQTTSPRPPQEQKEIHHAYKPKLFQGNHQLAATKIQAAYRGYVARKSFRALRGLVRLQGVVRGQNVKRQTVSALKSMQLLVRVHTQVQSRRIQMLENQAQQHEAYNHDKDIESTLSKWTKASEAGVEEWDDSLLKKEEVEGRLQKKVEAVIKRERAMAYAYSHQLWKANPKSAQTSLRSRGFPWWWAWLERQLSAASPSEHQSIKTNIQSTPPRQGSEHKVNQVAQLNYKKHSFGFDGHDVATPKSSVSAVTFRKKQMNTPSRMSPTSSASTLMKYSKTRASAADFSGLNSPLRDDDSLVSCPPFSVPNYMVPTVSTKAKLRIGSSPKERFSAGTPTSESKRRFSFPPTPNSVSSRLNKGSGKDSPSPRVLEKHQSLHSNLSVDSTVSMPAALGRKPFNRFV